MTVPISAGLLADTGAYFAALTSYRDGDAAPIVECFSRATVLAIANGRQSPARKRFWAAPAGDTPDQLSCIAGDMRAGAICWCW